MLGAVLIETVAVYSMTIAYQSDSSGFVSLISYMLVIYAFFADIFVFCEQFKWLELVAALVILLVTVATSIFKLRQSKRNKEIDASDSFKKANEILCEEH